MDEQGVRITAGDGGTDDSWEATTSAADGEWLTRAIGESGAVTLRPVDDEVEGHLASTSVVLEVLADGDTEGHAISVHFPSLDEAQAFRRRLVLTGALAGTIALGAAGGMGLANLSSDEPAAAGAAAAGMEWSQAERPGANVAAAGVGSSGMEWSQAERPGANVAAAEGEIGDAVLRDRGPQPR